MSYQETSVLITGASQGIGRSIAITFAALTNRPLYLLARNLENLEETKTLCEKAGAANVEIAACDLTAPTQVEALSIPANFPQPGIVINNAGGYLYKTLSETTVEEFRHQVDVNLFSAVNVVNRFRDALLKLDRALIVNICSVGALRGLADSGAYSAAKHALLGYTRSLRDELKNTKIAVSAINLGQTHSPSWDESAMSPEKLVDPSDISKIIVIISELSERSVVEEIIIQPQHGRVPAM